MLWTVVLEKTLESPLDCKEIQPVHPKGDQSWIFIGRTDAEAEALILWPPDAKNWLIGKDPDSGKDWRWEEKGTTEDENVGWHHWLDGHEFEQVPGVDDGQGSLACCSPLDRKELDTTATELLNWTELGRLFLFSMSILLLMTFSFFPNFVILWIGLLWTFLYMSLHILNSATLLKSHISYLDFLCGKSCLQIKPVLTSVQSFSYLCLD